MPMTLMEAAKIHRGDVIRSGVIEMYAQNSDILRVLPFINIPGGAYHYTQEAKLPGVGFRGINEGYQESVGVLNPQAEVLRIAGGDMDVDTAIIKMNGPEVRSIHEAAKIKASALYFTKKFIKGDSTADVKEFDGIQNRITGSQLIEAGTTNGGDALSLSKVDELIDAVDGSNKFLLMGQDMRRKFTQAARTPSVGGNIEYKPSDFGRTITVYEGVPILEVDIDELGARILGFNEVASTGVLATATSIYCVNFAEDALTGLQNGVMEVRDLGELDSKPVLRTRVEWLVSVAALQGRCAARLRGISNVPMVA